MVASFGSKTQLNYAGCPTVLLSLGGWFLTVALQVLVLHAAQAPVMVKSVLVKAWELAHPVLTVALLQVEPSLQLEDMPRPSLLLWLLQLPSSCRRKCS
mmetsp:Transcript_6815/g.25556  ORF Transcript_6815/g.25556 Transcript_6815/m.25556 type:complete len:99 (-) Transcript_6815:49-345(-)